MKGSGGVLAAVDSFVRRRRLLEALRLLRAHPELPPDETRRRLARLRALEPAARRRAGRAAPEARKLLIIDATTRCNQSCAFCFERSVHFTKPDLPFSEVERILENAGRDGFTHVNFIGGEITLVPWLPRAARLICRLGMSAGLVTNGLALSSRRAAEELIAAGIRWIELSFLSHEPEVDFRTGGVRRGLELRLKTLENLRVLKDGSPLSLGINIVLTAFNSGALPRTLETLLPYGPDLVMLKGVQLTDNIEDARVVPRFDELRGPLVAAMGLLEAKGVPFLFEDIPLCFVRPEYWLEQPEREGVGGVGFSYEGADGGPDFRVFTGRDGAGLAKCSGCAVAPDCCLPSKRYVALFGAGEFGEAGRD